MDSNIDIVAISDDHIVGFRDAVAAVAAERKFLATFEGFSLDATCAFVTQNLSKGLPNLVAVRNGQVVGWCDVCSIDKPVMQHTGVLGMGVLKEYRGKGVGKRLIVQAIEAAKAVGLTRIQLYVREDNERAIKLYLSVGFEKEGVLRKAMLVDGIYYNNIAMALLFA